MPSFWSPLIGGVIGGGSGVFLAELIRRWIRHHGRMERERDEELRIALEEVEAIRAMAVRYWLQTSHAAENAELQAAILGRLTPMHAIVERIFAENDKEKREATELLSGFMRAVSDGEFFEPNRAPEPDRLRRVEHHAAALKSGLRHLRMALPRKFWSD